MTTRGGGSGGAERMRLAHHFDDPLQQVEASKLGMWIFLATELLLFGGLFCAYAVFRANHPEIFHWGHRLLDVELGAVNTVILLASSFTVAWAVRAAQLGQRSRLILALALTIAAGAGFLGIKYVEYRSKWTHGLLWGRHYAPEPGYLERALLGMEAGSAEGAGPARPATAGDPERGRRVFEGTCASCHGMQGEGIPGQGVALAKSEFVAAKSDEELLAFTKVGRQPFDPESKTRIAMPPRGGNPALKDEDLRDALAYVRVLQARAASQAPPAETSRATVRAEASATADAALALPRSVLPPAPRGPAGTVEVASADPETGPPRIPDLRLFFSAYFLLTGLHALHVLAGLLVLAWLVVRAALGHFGSLYYTPVDLGALYWHLVDVIWIFLFPLFYLIH